MLRGNAIAKVDPKGRLKLPAVYRSYIEPLFGRDLYVTSIQGDSVRVYPLEVYTALEDKLHRASPFQPTVRRVRNALNYYGQQATMDNQGRVLIHPLLREKADIDGEVAVLGVLDYLDVWNRAHLEQRLEQEPLTDSELRELAELGL